MTQQPIISSHSNPRLITTTLSVGYAEHQYNCLFEDLNLTLHSGELVCFMGPNGIGKSTLIRTLAGLQKPLSGEVKLDAATNSFKKNAKTISVVLTDKLQGVNMTVRELVTLGRYPYLDWNIRLSADDVTAIDRAIQLTRIESITDKKLFEISDGQTQMAMIARALAQDGDVIILDEPTAHLDLNNRVEIMNLLRSLSRKLSKAVLVSTHELDLALQMADTIWLAGRGKQIITGIPEDLVLTGVFDEIFRFKGFDLKTGRVFHEAYRGVAIQLTGNGHEFLWTKNALERCGFRISVSAPIQINIEKTEGMTRWILDTAKQLKDCSSIESLLSELSSITFS